MNERHIGAKTIVQPAEFTGRLEDIVAPDSMTVTEIQDAIRLAHWQPIKTAPKDREIDLWFSYPGIGYRPGCRWSEDMGMFAWHGSVPGDGEWCICSLPGLKPTHWAKPLHLNGINP